MDHTPYWNIRAGFLIDLLGLIAIAIFCYGLFRHLRRIQSGAAISRLSKDMIGQFVCAIHIKRLFVGGILGSRVYRDWKAGISHGALFWGMIVLFFGTVMVMFNVFFGLPTMSGSFYKWGMAFLLDLSGLAVFAGTAALLIRRLGGIDRLVSPKSRDVFIVIEIWVLLLIVSGYFLEGIRISSTGASEPAIIGNLFASMFPESAGAQQVHMWLWWGHGILALALIAYIPFSPLAHLVLSPADAGVAEDYIGSSTEALGMDSEDARSKLGAETIGDFDPRQRLDFAACLWCGRCQEVCPATLTEKRLTPKGVMTELAEWLEESRMQDEGLIDAIGRDVLFECRTCGACAETCPTFVNPITSIWQMRRNLVMERGDVPENLAVVLRNMEAQMQPFTSAARPTDWSKGLDVPVFKANETEYLLWIGCAVTYEDRAQAVGRAMVSILNRAGVSYGIIEEARCTGDPAKQIGDDYLFSMMARANIDLFNDLGVRDIITLCPHCYNSFAHYYPPLGAELNPMPHGAFLHDLIRDQKLQLKSRGGEIGYHDPCYLGRYNGIYDQPRDVLRSMGTIVEMGRSRSMSSCCGAGGGNYWNEEEGDRINQARAKEAWESGAGALVSSCPFCLLMLTDGIKSFTDDPFVFDIAELVEEHMVSPQSRPGTICQSYRASRGR